MKKRLISLVAAAALVGGMATVAPSVASAGTVTVKGDTQVQLYGRLKFLGAWGAKFNPLGENTAYKAQGDGAAAKKQNKTNFKGFKMSGAGTALGLNFSNKDANLTGKIELGMGGRAANNSQTANLRHAYIQHNLDNGLYVLIGQTNNTFEVHTFNALPEAMAGFDQPARSPQIAVGGKFDIADSANIDFKAALLEQDYMEDNNTVQKNRRAFPTVGLNVGVNFETGFGAPARVYGNYLVENRKFSYNNDNETSKTGYAFGIGAVVPISMVTVQGEYIHAKGLVGLAGVNRHTAGNLKDPVSYWIDNNNNMKTVKFDAWNLEAKVAPMPSTSFAAGYGYLKFKNMAETTDNIKKNKTFFINAAVKTTKYTTLTLEYDHVKTTAYKDNNGNTADYKGNGYFLSYSYAF